MHIDTLSLGLGLGLDLDLDLDLDLSDDLANKHLNPTPPPPLVTSGQLSLGLELSTKMTLNDFINTDNQAITTNIYNLIELESKKITHNQNICENSLYLYGPKGSGKTHLLHGICHLANEKQLSSIYLDARSITEKHINSLDDMQYLEVICIDNIEHIAKKKKWELAFFNLFNRVYTQGTSLIMTSSQKPKQLDIQLPDLLSRLQWVLAFKIHELKDDDILKALKNKCKQQGLEISEDTLKFMILRLTRNINDLSIAIERLTNLAISTKRRLTIPFVKKVLNI